MPAFDDFSISNVGFDQLIARLELIPQNAPEAALEAMFELCDKKVLPAIKEVTPFKGGALASSGVLYREGKQIIIEFGGQGSFPNTAGEPSPNEYAVEQHENTFIKHSKPGTAAKYVETPLAQWSDRIIEAAGQGVTDVLTIKDWSGSRDKVISRAQMPESLHTQFFRRMQAQKAPTPAPTGGKAPPRLVKKPKKP